jgi:hypothetical protein
VFEVDAESWQSAVDKAVQANSVHEAFQNVEQLRIKDCPLVESYTSEPEAAVTVID